MSAALALHTLLGLYGERACGDLAREAPPAEVDQLRRAWAHQLARDEAQARYTPLPLHMPYTLAGALLHRCISVPHDTQAATARESHVTDAAPYSPLQPCDDA